MNGLRFWGPNGIQPTSLGVLCYGLTMPMRKQETYRVFTFNGSELPVLEAAGLGRISGAGESLRGEAGASAHAANFCRKKLLVLDVR